MRPARVRQLSLRSVLATVVAGATVLSGCGHQVWVANHERLQIVLMEYRLRPDRISVSAGTLRLFVRNLGRLSHNLSVVRGGSHVVSTTALIAPGRSARLVVRLPPGLYTIASTVQSDETLGIRGALRVTRG